LGYPTTVAGIYAIEEDLWLDHCRHVYSDDFLRFVAEYRDREVMYFRKALEKHRGGIPLPKLHALLAGLGYKMTSEQTASIASSAPGPGGPGRRSTYNPDGLLGLWDLIRLAGQCRNEIRQQVRQNFGLLDKEVAGLCNAFNRHDPDRKGTITRDDLTAILKDLHSQRGTAALERLEAVVRTVGGGAEGAVSFEDFLRVVRLLHDYADWDVFRKLKRALSDLGLNQDEVDGFREVFHKFGVSKPGMISVREIMEMLVGIVPANATAEDPELVDLIREAVGVGVLAKGVDFPDFMRVMLKLLRTDWHGINSCAGKIARKVNPGHEPD